MSNRIASEHVNESARHLKVVSPGKVWAEYVGRAGSVYLPTAIKKTVASPVPSKNSHEHEYWTISHERGHPVLPEPYEPVPLMTGRWQTPSEPIPIRQSLIPESGPGLQGLETAMTLGARFTSDHGFFQNEKPRHKSSDIQSVFQGKGVIVLATCNLSSSAKVIAESNVRSIIEEPTPIQVLAALRSPRRATQFDAVIDASHTKFTDAQRPELLDSLRDFIGQNLYTRIEYEITVVGSAVRKYALNMNESQFENYSNWLQPKQTEYPHHRVELELIKGICWRLAYEPVETKISFTKLRETLLAIGRNYTTDRFLLQKNYAAVALNSIVSVFILDAIKKQKASAKKLVSRLREADLSWFDTMVVRRLKTCAKDIGGHDANLAKNLSTLIADVGLLETNR